MINFKYPGIEDRIPFEPGVIHDLVIENPDLLYRFVLDLKEENEDTVIFSEDETLIPLKDLYLLITDPYSLDPNLKKYLNGIYKSSDKRFLNEERRESLLSIQESINRLLYDISFDFDVPVTFKDQLLLSNLFDMAEFSFDTDFSSMETRVLSFLKMVREISKTKYVFIVGFLDMIKSQEMDAFLKEIEYLGMTIVNISSRASSKKNSWVRTHIIDGDLCQF